MSTDLTEALQLLFVGMFTVFFILLIVVLLGKLLIRFVNRTVSDQSPTTQTVPTAKISNTASIPKPKLVAISSAIHTLTGGRAKVVEITKV